MSNTFLRFANYQVSQVLAWVSGYHTPLSVSIGHLEEVKTARRLTKAMNEIQNSLWKLTAEDRLSASQRVVDVLSQLVLTSSDTSLRLAAADWSRFLVQEGVVSQPGTVFTTLVTAAIHAAQGDIRVDAQELRTYLRLIMESFWPFRAPYAAYPRELFPSKAVFYPLFRLLSHADSALQESLLIIFAQLPTLDDVASAGQVLSPARTGSSHADLERQKRAPCIPTW